MNWKFQFELEFKISVAAPLKVLKLNDPALLEY